MLQEILSLPVLLTLGKITALLLAAFAIAPFIKHPSLRASLWITTILVLPLIAVFSSSFSVIELIPPITQTKVAPVLPLETPPPFLLDSLAPSISYPDFTEKVASQPTVQVTPDSTTPFPLLTLTYFLGTAIVLLPILSSQIKLRLLKKSQPSGAPHKLWQILSSTLSPKASLHFTPSPSAPFASGILKPTILIPHESQSWSATRLQSTLLHEVAHLKRHDPLTRFLSSLVKALLWFHPLVWLAHRQLIAAQEQACDQYALTFGIEPEDYAADLLSSATHSHTTPSQALAMARWSQIGNRIRHILNSNNHYQTTMKKIASICTIVSLSALAISSIGFAKQIAPEAKNDSQKEGITPAAWDAAKKTLAALDNELIKQSETVKKHQEALTALIQKHGIPNIDEDAPHQKAAPKNERFKNAQQQLSLLKTQHDQMNVEITKLLEMKGEKLVEHVAGLNLPENPVKPYFAQYEAAAQEQRQLLAKGRGKDHPDRIAVEKKIKAAMKNAQSETASFKAVLNTKLGLIERQMKRIEQSVADREGDLVDLTKKQHPYHQAKETYEQSRIMLRAMKIKQQEARALLKMPRQPIPLNPKAK
ncbi:MAG: M56 family metallopeptidase [Verrucomicrobiales bacterium]